MNEPQQDPGEPTDAELAGRAAGGDQAALAAIFDRYAGNLLAFCRSMVRNQADADDCLQDIFVTAASRLGGLRQPERLRSWLFAVARHTCLAHIERGARMVPTDDPVDDAGAGADPAAQGALDADLAAMVDEAMGGMAPRDRLVLELADRQGLSTDEVAGALGMAAPSAYKVLVRARAIARRSLGAALVARSGQRECPQLAVLLGDWDGKLTPLVRKRVSRHIEACATCSSREQRLAAPGALLGAGAAVAVPVGLRAKVLQSTAGAPGIPASGPSAASSEPTGSSMSGSGVSEPGTPGPGVPGPGAPVPDAGQWVEGWPPRFDGRSAKAARTRRRTIGAGAAVAVIAAIGVVAILQPWSHGSRIHRAVTVDAAQGGVTAQRPAIRSFSVTCSSSSGVTRPIARWTTSGATDVTIAEPGGSVDAGPAGTLVLGQAAVCDPGTMPTRYALTAVGTAGRAKRTTVLVLPQAVPTAPPVIAPTTTPSYPKTLPIAPSSRPGAAGGSAATTPTMPSTTTTQPSTTTTTQPSTTTTTQPSTTQPSTTTTTQPSSTTTTQSSTTTTTLPVIQ